MSTTRRDMMAGGLALAMLGSAAGAASPADKEGQTMYGLIGRMFAKPGTRDTLIAILTEGSSAMPGCRSYIVARDAKDPDAIFVTEVWASREAHAASLKLPSVQSAIARGRPLIARFDTYFETEPVSGVGLV
ncbi:putative quinol monooxygenase [Rhizorhabdus sp. FW153]|uniref:putative quinol monooxygenase n=1 Tax=Rhizorhabdus sp. FW153 TaxID=3400216 RepID=UPI003CEF23AA